VQPLTKRQVLRELYRSRIGSALKGLFLLILIGTVGFYALGLLHQEGVLAPRIAPAEHWTLLDCFYFTTITLSTVGYGETLGKDGLAAFPDVRIFNVGLVLLGMIATAYFLSSATAFFVEGDLKRVLERRSMLKKIAALRDHFIVCGAGQTGRHIAEEVTGSGHECVVIDASTETIASLAEHGVKVHSLVGDAMKDETLLEAGIERARGLAAALTDDRDNLFLVISARQLNPKLRIISKAIDMPTRAKLLRAGADGVVASNYIGGLRMASELLRPAVVNFLDQMLRNKEAPVRFAEVTVGARPLRTVGEIEAQSVGLPILAVKQPRVEGFLYNPPPATPVVEGTVLVVMGEVARVKRLEQLVQAGGGFGSTILGTQPRQVITIEPEPQPAQTAPPAPAPTLTRADELKDPRDNL